MVDQIVKNFEELVELNFQLYSNLFLTIPMDDAVKTGMLIPILRDECEKGMDEGRDPVTIINDFLSKNRPGMDGRQKIDFLFQVIQYVERQILLVDSLEDAAFDKIHRVDGPHSLQQFLLRVKSDNLEWKMKHFIANFGVRVVLTAHPTQFYPGTVLAISSDLSSAIAEKRTSAVRDFMHQLSKTPFFRKEKPTPFNEAQRLAWYLVNVFYPAGGELMDMIASYYPDEADSNPQLISFGFWPGGDRDGNPFVNVDTTLKVAGLLKSSIITCYLDSLKMLKKRLTFVGIIDKLEKLEEYLDNKLTGQITGTGGLKLQKETVAGDKSNEVDLPVTNPESDYSFFFDSIIEIERSLAEKHHSLFLNLFQNFRRKVFAFRWHFASLDIRQDSRIIAMAFEAVLLKNPGLLPDGFEQLTHNEQINAVINIDGSARMEDFDDEMVKDTIGSIAAIRKIQSMNGEFGCNRYIISNCRGAVDVARILAMLKLTGWKEPEVDIVPLFETIEDLRGARDSMLELYWNSSYQEHLKRRHNKQTVMLGFSDGTKDGGYITANWSIFIAKESLSRISRDAGIEVIFFDGRGGPPARGGGNAHLFYSALGSKIESREIQLTLQGQTISSHYGIKESAMHNLGYLITAGLSNNLYSQAEKDLTDEERALMEELADSGFRKYNDFKNHPLFIPYLEEKSTLKYYGMANISSRPTSRKNKGPLKLEDLRAIPFVGAWSQLKQNVPGYFGFGTALKEQEDKGALQQCAELYQRSPFFRALVSNSMQSISKSNFQLTKYMSDDQKFGEFWKILYDEFQLTRQMLLKVSGMVVLLEDNPRSRKSIRLRENIVLPLLVIQQYALMMIEREETEHKEIYEKLVMRSLFGNINAARNAV
ncbi:MAG TPA: phosphoenolpyruvate carboxylase [Lentimicrobium sp.]|nr:phosphoenolpyruvate carboxylase [Lentimicrobium sp.]